MIESESYLDGATSRVFDYGTISLQGLTPVTVPLLTPVPDEKLMIRPFLSGVKVSRTVVNGSVTEVVFTWINTTTTSMYYELMEI